MKTRIGLLHALIPCGGTGNRLQPMTKIIEKPLIPLMGRPMVDWVLESLALTGVTSATIILPPDGKSQIPAYYDGAKPWGIELQFQTQSVVKGDFGTAILEAWSRNKGHDWYLASSPDAPFIQNGRPVGFSRLIDTDLSTCIARYLAVPSPTSPQPHGDAGNTATDRRIPLLQSHSPQRTNIATHTPLAQWAEPRHHWLVSERFLELFSQARDTQPNLLCWEFAAQSVERGLRILPTFLASDEKCFDLGNWDSYHGFLRHVMQEQQVAS